MATEASRLTEAYFERPKKTETWSGFPVKEVYSPADTKDIDYDGDVAEPGQYPYTRGIYRDMYRGRFDMSGPKRPFQLDFTPAAGHRKMPTAYQARPKTPGADVDVCFSGRIAVSRLRWPG